MVLMGVAGAACAQRAGLDEQVLEFTRQALLEQARHAGLLAPEVQLSLPASSPARPPCAAGWDLSAADLRSLLHLHVIARCADGRTPIQDFWLRGTLAADVLVLAHAVPPGQALAESDVTLEHRDISATPDAVSSLDRVADLAPRASLRAGEVLQQRLLQALPLVHRGDAVRIVARHDGVEVEAGGEALDEGARGATVRVRNSNSGRVISARVIEAGVVEPAQSQGH